jgi:uncharacterized membrane protein
MKIKKNKFVFGLAIFSLLFVSFWFLLGLKLVKGEGEVINDFKANLTIQKDGLVFVTEKIVYDFGLNQKHGIDRNIPLTSNDGQKLKVSVLSVQDERGEPYKYTSWVTNNILQIQIGDPNVLVSGVKTYIINYKVSNAIRTFKDHNELYWNVTGNEWPVSILNASALVNLPDLSLSNVKMDCFTGLAGSTQKNCVFNQNGSVVSYSITQPLGANEGLTFVLGIPLGYIHTNYISPQQNYFGSQVLLNFKFFLIFFGLIIFVIWYKKMSTIWKSNLGKIKPIIPSQLKTQPIVVEYNPPDNLSPIEIGMLLTHRVSGFSISSVIIDLAVRGYIRIRYTVSPVRFLPDKKDFELIKLKDGLDLVSPADKIVFGLLFSGRESVKLSELKEQRISFQVEAKRIQEEVERSLYNKGYFDEAAKNQSKKLKIYLSILAVILLVGFFVSQYLLAGLGLVLMILLAGALVSLSFVMSRLAYKLTPQGIATLGKILGFKEFLQLTEKDKLQLLDAPELQPEMFEKFLPYAMVLGIEDKWAQKFEGIYSTIPSWYEDPTITSFNSYLFIRNLTLFNSSFNQVFTTTSSVRSGFGRGGFSGGGSGGGGGRSW